MKLNVEFVYFYVFVHAEFADKQVNTLFLVLAVKEFVKYVKNCEKYNYILMDACFESCTPLLN